VEVTIPCSRCRERPRHHGQRWCLRCLGTAKSARYWRLRAETGPRYEEVVPDVSPTPSLAEKPVGLCCRCGMGAWFEWSPNDWRCQLCGIGPAM
jgi:hypothetical protein